MCHEGSYNTLPLVSPVYERRAHPINFEPNYAPATRITTCPFVIATLQVKPLSESELLRPIIIAEKSNRFERKIFE